jgi:hypothetical protein
MSDFFVKRADGTWAKAVNIFIKLASGAWQAASSIFLKLNAIEWIKVWPLSGIFSTRAPWIGPNSDTVFADRLTSSSRIRIGSNYYGNNAQWNPNGWSISSYSYAWKYYDQFGGLLGTLDSGTGSGWTTTTGQDLLPTTIWTSTVSTNTDRQFLAFEVTANQANPIYSGSATSTRIQIIRRIPINLTTSLTDLTPEVGVQTTYSSTWDTAEARKAEDFRTTIQWYRNSSNSTTGGTAITGALSASYTPVAADVGNYLYVVETRFNSGTDFDLGSNTGVEAKIISTSTVTDINFQATGNQRRTQLPSNFTAGTILYISTNGYIGIGSDPGTSISVPGTGLYLMPLAGDQRQTALWTFSDATNFYVRWQGARYNDPSQTIDYQAKFYWNSTNVDVHFVTNNLSSSNTASPVAVLNNGAIFRNWSASTSQASALISTASMTRNTTQDTVDDNRTAITAALAPTVSTLARADGTETPTQPSVLSFSSSDNQVTTSWTNGSPITSVRFQGSGAGVNTDYVDSTSPFMTSDVSDYTSSATYSATVTNSNNALRILVTWTQSNARSYRIYYNSSTQGSDQRIGNFTGTNAEIYIPWSTIEGTFSLTGVSVYSGDNQTGSEAFLSSASSAITPTAKSSSRSGSVSLTYTAPVANATAPTTVTATGGDSKVTVTWSGDTNATKYRIWWSTSATGNQVNPEVSFDAERTVRNVEFTLSNGTTYYFWVSASNTNNVWTSYSSSPRGQATPSAGTAPSVPGTPTLTYVSSQDTSTEWGYSATWTNSTSGTTPISYFLSCYGSSDGYVAVQTERGPYSSGSPAVSFRLPKTSTLWRVAAFAQNSIGTSTESAKSNSA